MNLFDLRKTGRTASNVRCGLVRHDGTPIVGCGAHVTTEAHIYDTTYNDGCYSSVYLCADCSAKEMAQRTGYAVDCATWLGQLGMRDTTPALITIGKASYKGVMYHDGETGTMRLYVLGDLPASYKRSKRTHYAIFHRHLDGSNTPFGKASLYDKSAPNPLPRGTFYVCGYITSDKVAEMREKEGTDVVTMFHRFGAHFMLSHMTQEQKDAEQVTDANTRVINVTTF